LANELYVLIELFHAYVAIAIRVERLEHGLVHMHLRAIALGEARVSLLLRRRSNITATGLWRLRL
jgi:hypothetical protein